jgi:GT2 family glycosyltransferase
MDVSVIIVSYQVKYFLEQCLASVNKSLLSVKGEVWVIDNASTDESIEYLEERFSNVHFIRNNHNVGFAKANNQVLDRISGKIVHFLNPDTIIPEDFYIKAIQFFESHPYAGAMGVQMIDGSGNYLRESKRGNPNYWSSFCKISGIWKLFPHSRVFSGYYQGFLPQNESNQVSVLSGACMILTKEAIDKTGGFDERFFMYAEDIDLSIRVKQQGYEVWYFPEITIIHFKGESTQKNTQNRQIFYQTMLQFVKKHGKGTSASIKAKVLSLFLPILVKSAQIQSKSVKNETNNSKIDIKYEEIQEIEDLKKILQRGKSISKNLLFKEGQALNYRFIITEIARLKNRYAFFIQGNNTNSIVGSSSQHNQGLSMKAKETKA